MNDCEALSMLVKCAFVSVAFGVVGYLVGYMRGYEYRADFFEKHLRARTQEGKEET